MQPTYYWPAEWAHQQAYWTAYPDKPQLWGVHLHQAQREVLALIEQLATYCAKVHVLTPPEPVGDRSCWAKLQALPIERHCLPYGDIWLRDTGPIVVQHAGRNLALQFQHNGWGNKYHLAYDHQLSSQIASRMDCAQLPLHWVVEGGALETDGDGLLLTTSTCLLSEQRNHASREALLSKTLQTYLGCQSIVWLEGQLLHDHTDGHIDTLVRCLPGNRLVCMLPQDKQDPNYQILMALYQQLRDHPLLRQRQTKLVTLPSPGLISEPGQDILPASYLNYVFVNQAVIMPTYGSKYDHLAYTQLQHHLPDMRIIALPARALLCGGGAFHCITQQYPAISAHSRS